MWPAEKERILKRYGARIQEHGAGFAALNSGTRERRAIRFGVLADIGIANGDSVLDLGCGLGDLLPFLRERGLDVTYTGYDINPVLIDAARQAQPDGTFEVRDILDGTMPAFDWIVCTSCFNLRFEDDGNYAFVQRILAQCYDHARKGVAMDFLTSYVDFPSAEGFHYEPEKLFTIGKQLTKRVALRHDYPLFEFALYLYPDFSGWQSPA